MAGRLLFGVALVAHVLVLVYCSSDQTSSATATSSTTETSQGSSRSRSSAKAISHASTKKIKKCDRIKRCPKNEEYSHCPQSLQRPQYCAEKGQPFSNAPADSKTCKGACVCKENYLRADNGTCIPAEQCPITCDDTEVLDNCPADCDSDYCPTEECSEECPKPSVCPPPACKCRFNYRRAINGSCIPTESCPPFDCSARPNEEYNPCPPMCPTDDCSQASPSGDCPRLFGRIGIRLLCNPKCRCIKGYWRKDGICVPYEQCPQSCPANEEFVPCMQGVCRAKDCSQKGEDVPCPDIPTEKCDSGCICKENFLRAENGSCVPEDQCEPTPTCPPNEEWSNCAQATCRAQNCTQKGKPIACPMIMEGYCIKACVCKENYLRNEKGDCVPENQCPPEITCGANEVLDNCPRTCTSDYCPKSEFEVNVCSNSEPCIPACKCRFNYRRAMNGTCIPTRSCPPFKCSAPNEEYVACPPLCPSDECGQPRLTGRCPYRIGIILNCEPKCQCKDGYGRVDGTCVPFEECPDLCPANEEYSACPQQTCRPLTCSDRDNVMKTCPTCDSTSCKRGCVCQENYYRNDLGKCVSYEACSGPLCPYAHEYYSQEFKECPPNTCRSLVSRYACDENQPLVRGCPCESGYLRLNLTTHCIPICDCPEMAGSPDC